MRGRRPALLCDGDEGSCGNWEIDHYEETCSAVDGHAITSTERAPGWTSTDLDDFCPEHKPVLRPGVGR